MDSVASTNTSKEESTTDVSPQYDSSEEWEIGLGNLIIDLDADLEKDSQVDGKGDGSNGVGAPADSSPLRIGKMKIKRKVSTNTAVGPKGSAVEGASPRKDNSLLSTEENSMSATAASPTPEKMVKDETVSTKSSGRNLNNSGCLSTDSTGGPHSKHDPSVTTGKHLVVTGDSSQAGSIPSGDIHGKYSSGNLTQDKETNMDNNTSIPICRIKPSTVDLKSQTVTVKTEKETASIVGGRKKEEKEGKEAMGKKGDGSAKKHGGKKKGDKASSNTIAVGTSDAGTITDPDFMGPCEPGTSVNLEGIVWHETDQGVLVVNVTWRNKTYVGTLLDCTRHDWAPPRFCDSPTSDVENRNTKACGRPKRGRASNNSNNNNDMSNFTETRSSVHSKLRNGSAQKGRKGANANGKPTNAAEKQQNKRKHRPAEVSASSGDDSKSAKRLKSSANQQEPELFADPISGLIECPEPNCNKKYKHVNGLRYHRQHAHQEKPDDDEEDDEDDSENKSSSDESSSSAQSDIVKSKSDWNDSNRTSDASATNDTKASIATNVQIDSAEKRQLQYSTAAAQAAATAAANAAAAASLEAKKLSADRTSPKLLGKSKDVTPVKSKGDLTDKTGKPKKGQISADKDLSVFDFNSAVDSDSSEKHVSVIRPTADMSATSPSKSGDAVTAIASAPAKLQDVIHTTALPGSEHLEELQKHSKKSDKDKSKSGDRKKGGKHDKVPSSKVKPTHPAIASPNLPQLVTLPANMTTKSAVAPAATQPVKIPPTNSKQQVNPTLKPIQPKQPVLSDATANVPNTNQKEKKNKSKKKSKDKDKEREKSSSAKDKEIKDPNVVNNKQVVLPPPVQVVKPPQQVAPAAPLPQSVPKQPSQQPGTIGNVLTETNILHQALTASGIGPEDAERNSPSVTNPADITKSDPSQAPKDQTKDVRPVFANRPPMHGNMPEPPKLIPTSSVVNSGGRAVGAVQPHLPPHQVKPLQPVQDCAQIEKSTLPLPRMNHNLLPDSDSSMQNSAQADESRATSPAYSDISDANEESEVPSKPMNECDPFSFPDAARNQAVKVGPPRDEHVHSKNLYTPLSTDVGRERLPDGIHKAQQDSMRTAPPLVQTPKPGDAAGKESSHIEGPDAKKPRKDTSSPRLPTSSEAGYRPPPSQAYPGHIPYMSAGFVMDPQYHMHLLNTDPHYRQQHEQFRHEQRQLQDKERIDRERHSTKEKPSPGKTQEDNRGERTIPRIKTEPITPPKRNISEKGQQERAKSDRPPSADKLKRKQLDFQKPGAENVAPANTAEASTKRSSPEESPRHVGISFIHQQHEEEMRQYYIYQQKVQEQQKYEEEQRRKLEESRSSSADSVKDKENRTEESRDRRSTPSPQCNPPKNRSPRPPSVEERKLRQSPSAGSCPSPMNKDPKAAMMSSSSRKLMDYPAYLQHTPYGPMPVHQTPYGPIPIDPNHPAYQHAPMIYPAFMGHELRGVYPGPVPMWKSPEDKAHFEHERSQAISPHQGPSSSRGESPSEPPPKALDLLQQHASRYYSQHKHDRSRSPSEKSRPSSPQRRTASPRKSPEAGSSSRETSQHSQLTAAMVHQHMHTHQHTHVGFPAVLPSPYDPFVLASQQAAAAAGVSAPYSVRRENMPS